MLVLDAIGCEAIISGPLIGEDLLPWNQLSSLDVNETHPARVRCQVTCLNQQGFYHPAMALIVTSQEQFIPIIHYFEGVDTYSLNGLYFEVDYQNFSHCNVQNNYTMEFEYLIYSNTSEIDRSVVTCGVKFRAHLHQNNNVCWGDTFGIVRYHGLELVSTDVPSPILTTTASPDCSREVRKLLTNLDEPVRIICETACDAAVCDPVLRLDIPGPAANEIPIIKYLPKENDVTELYFLRDLNVSWKEKNIIIAEFNIVPRSIIRFLNTRATCQWNYKYTQDVNTNFCGEVYVILFIAGLIPDPTEPPPIPTDSTSDKSYYTEFKIIIITFSAAVIVLIAVAIVPAVGFLYSVKLRERTTPDSRIEEQASPLVVKLEDISTAAEEEVKSEEVDQSKVDDSSMTKNNLVRKIDLPDFISSRSD